MGSRYPGTIEHIGTDRGYARAAITCLVQGIHGPLIASTEEPLSE